MFLKLGLEQSIVVVKKTIVNFRESHHTFAVVAKIPKALKVSYSSRSSTFSSKFPTNRFAPTSNCFLSEEAWKLDRQHSLRKDFRSSELYNNEPC